MEASARAAGLPPGRLQALTDGIFAIVMTILVLDLRVPELALGEDLPTRLGTMLPRFTVFFVSFVVLGVYWFGQHQIFHFVIRVNRALVWLSILFLLSTTLVPFATSLLGSYYQNPVALTLYGTVLSLSAIVGYVIWWYVTGDRGLIEGKLDPDLVGKVHRWIAAGPMISFVAIALAWVQPLVALAMYLVLPVLFVFFNPVDSYLERLRRAER